MRVLVTGNRGFIGQHLTRELLLNGHTVEGVDLEDGRDLRIPGVAEIAIGEFQPDVVVHLAAKVGRLFGEDFPPETIQDNAGMTALVARATAAASARLVYASTSEVYGDNGDRACYEHTGPWTLPHNIYGLSKLWGEQVCQLYAPEGLTVLRFSMPYGPGLPAGRGRAAIINMLYQGLHRQPMPVHRGAERNWCWIGDTVRAAVLAIHKGEGPYNIGRDDRPTRMLDVAELACNLTNAPEELIRIVDAPQRQTVVKRLNMERIRHLGWEPEVHLETGMALTLEWVKQLDEDGLPRQEG